MMPDPRKRPPLGPGSSELDERERFGRARPDDVYKDLKDELTRAYHESALARTYEERVAWLKRFVQLGVEFLPEEDMEYKRNMRKFMSEKVQIFQPNIKPIFDDKQSIYEINHNIGGGGSIRCHIIDFDRIMVMLRETKYEEVFNDILPIGMELAARLQKNDILEFERDYYESVTLEGDWAFARPRMPFIGDMEEPDEDEESEEDRGEELE